MKIHNTPVSKKIVTKFWSRVRILDQHQCWDWQAGFNSSKKGFEYGIFWIPKLGNVLSHRLALSFYRGKEVSPCLDVIHSCDRPQCCNPYHLREGTAKDNAKDRTVRKRHNPPKGTKNTKAILDDAKVRKIRKLADLRAKYLKYTYSYIAKIYGVDKNTIRQVALRKTWKHVRE